MHIEGSAYTCCSFVGGPDLEGINGLEAKVQLC